MRASSLLAISTLLPGVVIAQPDFVLPPSERPAAEPSASPGPTITVGGYLEAYYQAHFQNPANRLTNLRGFDNRSRTFTLSNVALDVNGETGPVTARVILQVGPTGSTYYLAEPVSAGSGSVNRFGCDRHGGARRDRACVQPEARRHRRQLLGRAPGSILTSRRPQRSIRSAASRAHAARMSAS